MDSEEKELLKKLLNKVDNLEKELHKRDKIIDKLNMQGNPEALPNNPKFPPMPTTKDRLAEIIVRKARQKLVEQAAYNQTPQGAMNRPKVKLSVEEIRKNFSLGEIMTYIWKKKVPIGNREDSGATEEVLKVELDE